MGSILGLLLPLSQELNISEQSEVVDQQDDLQAMLHQLKGVAQTLAQVSSPQVTSQNAKKTCNPRIERGKKFVG